MFSHWTLSQNCRRQFIRNFSSVSIETGWLLRKWNVIVTKDIVFSQNEITSVCQSEHTEHEIEKGFYENRNFFPGGSPLRKLGLFLVLVGSLFRIPFHPDLRRQFFSMVTLTSKRTFYFWKQKLRIHAKPPLWGRGKLLTSLKTHSVSNTNKSLHNFFTSYGFV